MGRNLQTTKWINMDETVASQLKPDLQPVAITPAQITANQDNYNPTSLTTAGCLRLSSDASRNITGIASGSTLDVLLLQNIGSNNIVLKDEDASSTAGNRFALNGDITLLPDTSILLFYDTSSTRWRALTLNYFAAATITDPTITALDSKFTIQDNSDPTKQFKFQASGITTATTRTYTVQDSDHVLVGRDTTDTLTNKTIDKDSNTITHLPFEMCIAVSDETTDLTSGTSKITFRLPFAVTLTAVRASVNTAPTGATIIVDINEGGVSILSTKLSIDVSEKTSTTAATPAVISDAALADDAEISLDIDQIGSTIAGAGLKVWLIGKRT